MTNKLAIKLIGILLIGFCGFLSTIQAAPGDLDLTLNGTGKVSTNVSTSIFVCGTDDVKVLPDNKFLVIGSVGTSPNPQVLLSRYNSDGTPDSTFGTNGQVTSNAAFYGVGMDIQSDGKIIVVASYTPGQSTYNTVILRFNSNGSVDGTFGNNGVVIHPILNPQDVVIQPDGKIVIVGHKSLPPQQVFEVNRFNSDGSLDNSFGSGGSATVSFPGSSFTYSAEASKILLQSDGKILAGGRLDGPSDRSIGLARFNSNGTLDDAFGVNGRRLVSINGTQFFNSMAIQPDGKIIMAGATGTLNDNYDFFLTRVNPDGSFDNSFGIGGFSTINISSLPDYIYDLVIQNDGKILVSGQTSEDVRDHSITARLNSNGTLDTTFGNAGKLVIRYSPDSSRSFAVALKNDGQSVVVGQAGLDVALAVISQTGTLMTQRRDNFGNGADTAQDGVVYPDGKIVVVGNYQKGSFTDFSLVRYLPDGTLDNTFGSGGKVLAGISNILLVEAFGAALQPDGKIVVVGSLKSAETMFRGNLFVARFNPDGSRDSTFVNSTGVFIFNNSIDSDGFDIAIQPDGKILVAGRWAISINGFNYDFLVLRLNPDGTRDSSFGTSGFYRGGVSTEWERANALAIQADGKIVAGGSHLIKLNSNGTVDTTFSPDLRSVPFNANDVAVQTDGKVLIGGTNVEDFLISRFNTNGTIDNSFGLNGTAAVEFGNFSYDVANSILLQPDGAILAGGYTQVRNTTQRNFAIARLTPNGILDNRFGIGGKVITEFGNGNEQIWGLTLQNDGKLIAVGEAFTSGSRDFAMARYLIQNNRNVFDFDGDGKTDISIFRPSNGQWWYQRSSDNQVNAFQFGASSDRIMPADYTGDGKTDVAIWRPASGEWFVLRSEDNSFYAVAFGASGDLPAPADFDADGKADLTVFRPSSGTWFINKSTGGTDIINFGQNGDVPTVSDFDGDGKADIAIYRPSNGQWWLNRSTAGVFAVTFGTSTDKPVQGDYTGDGKADIAFFKSVSGEWFILRSEDLSYYSVFFGINGDVPTPGDYDGDGRFDTSVFRPSNQNWYINRTTSGTLIQQFGQAGDKPVPSAFVP